MTRSHSQPDQICECRRRRCYVLLLASHGQLVRDADARRRIAWLDYVRHRGEAEWWYLYDLAAAHHWRLIQASAPLGQEYVRRYGTEQERRDAA